MQYIYFCTAFGKLSPHQCEKDPYHGWAEKIEYLHTVIYPNQKKVILVMDNLNTNTCVSLYKVFPSEKARNLAKQLNIRYTLKYGSWLNIE